MYYYDQIDEHIPEEYEDDFNPTEDETMEPRQFSLRGHINPSLYDYFRLEL